MIGHFPIYVSDYDIAFRGSTFSSPQGIAYDSVNNRMAIVNDGKNVVFIFNSITFDLIATVTLPTAVYTGIVYDSVNNRFLITVDSETICRVIDGVTYAVTSFTIAKTSGEVSRGIEVDVINDRIFITGSSVADNKIFVHKASDFSSITTISVNRPLGILYDNANNLLYVTCVDNVVRIFNATTYALISTVSGSGVLALNIPLGLSYSNLDSNIIYIANSTGNKLSILNRTSRSITGQISGVTNAKYIKNIGNDLYVSSEILSKILKFNK